MTNSIFLKAGVVSVVYIIVKFLEMRFIIKENKPLKKLARDGLIVYFSVLGGDFVLQQIQPLSENLNTKVAAFTNAPNF
jgi:hypothetical protein